MQSGVTQCDHLRPADGGMDLTARSVGVILEGSNLCVRAPMCYGPHPFSTSFAEFISDRAPKLQTLKISKIKLLQTNTRKISTSDWALLSLKLFRRALKKDDPPMRTFSKYSKTML